MSTVYHVEHGQTKLDAEGKAQGLLSEGLTEKGKSQAAAAGRALRGKGIDCVYCSPLVRAKETARIVADQIGAQVVVRPKLRPLDIGSLAGKPEETVKGYRKFFATRPTLSFPAGEKFGAWYDQIRREWQQRLNNPQTAVVSHSIDRQLLKHWQKHGMDAGPQGIDFDLPLAGQVARVSKDGKALTVRAL